VVLFLAAALVGWIYRFRASGLQSCAERGNLAMLSTERDIRAERAIRRIALVASALLHLLFLPPALWFLRFAPRAAAVRPTPRDVLALSTSIQIEPRVVPNAPTQPHRQTQATQRPAQPLQPQRASAPAPRPEPRPVPRHEIARVVPSAAPQRPALPSGEANRRRSRSAWPPNKRPSRARSPVCTNNRNRLR